MKKLLLIGSGLLITSPLITNLNFETNKESESISKQVKSLGNVKDFDGLKLEDELVSVRETNTYSIIKKEYSNVFYFINLWTLEVSSYEFGEEWRFTGINSKDELRFVQYCYDYSNKDFLYFNIYNQKIVKTKNNLASDSNARVEFKLVHKNAVKFYLNDELLGTLDFRGTYLYKFKQTSGNFYDDYVSFDAVDGYGGLIDRIYIDLSEEKIYHDGPVDDVFSIGNYEILVNYFEIKIFDEENKLILSEDGHNYPKNYLDGTKPLFSRKNDKFHFYDFENFENDTNWTYQTNYEIYHQDNILNIYQNNKGDLVIDYKKYGDSNSRYRLEIREREDINGNLIWLEKNSEIDVDNQLLISNDLYKVELIDNQLQVIENGIKIKEANFNYFYEDATYYLDTKDFVFDLDNNKWYQVLVNGNYIVPDKDGIYHLDFNNVQTNVINLKLKTSTYTTTIHFKVIKDYMPSIKVMVPTLGYKEVDRMIYETYDGSLVDGYYSMNQMVIDFSRDNMIKSIEVNDDPFVNWETDLYVPKEPKTWIKIIDKFNKKWEYKIYYQNRADLIYWNSDAANPSESIRGQKNTLIANELGYLNYQINRMNAYESETLTNRIENKVLNLDDMFTQKFEPVSDFVENKITEWYGARMPINRLSLNNRLDVNGNDTGKTLKEVIEPAYIEGINQTFGNGIEFDGVIDTSDIAIKFIANANELLNENNDVVVVKAIKSNTDAKVIGEYRTSWGRIAFEYIDLGEFDAPGVIYDEYLKNDLDNLLKEYTDEPIKWNQIEKQANEVVINSINRFVNSDDNNISPDNANFNTELATLKANEIWIDWNFLQDIDVNEIEKIDVTIRTYPNGLAINSVNLKIDNYLYGYSYPALPHQFQDNLIPIIIIFSFVVLLILVITIISIARYQKDKWKFNQ